MPGEVFLAPLESRLVASRLPRGKTSPVSGSCSHLGSLSLAGTPIAPAAWCLPLPLPLPPPPTVSINMSLAGPAAGSCSRGLRRQGVLGSSSSRRDAVRCHFPQTSKHVHGCHGSFVHKPEVLYAIWCGWTVGTKPTKGRHGTAVNAQEPSRGPGKFSREARSAIHGKRPGWAVWLEACP